MTSMTTDALGTILSVWAHPDDEAYLSAGLMAAARDAGNRVVTVTATRGEYGNPEPDRLSPTDVGRMREHEMKQSLAELGVIEHTWMDYIDGEVDNVPQEIGMWRIADMIETIRPDTILTFGPDGMTGHPDHISVSNWTTAAWQLTGRRGHLLHAVVSPAHMADFEDLHRQFNVYAWGRPPEVSPADADMAIKLSGADLERKFRALRAQASQTAGLIEMLGETRYKAWIDEELYVSAERSLSPAA